MATDGPNPPPCDPEIFQNGDPFLMLGEWEGGSNAIERWCLKVAELSGERVDWSFCAGRAVFKVLGDKNKAQEAALSILPEVGCGEHGHQWL